MQLKTIIANVNKSKEFEDSYIDTERIANLMDLHGNFTWAEQDRLKAYFIMDWYCTDSRVGERIYYFDDVPVAISMKSGRKSTERIGWFSEEAYRKVETFILSFLEKPESNFELISSMDEDVELFYKVIHYAEMFKHHKENAHYKGANVKVVACRESFNRNGEYVPEQVQIQFRDGTFDWVETDKLDFRLNIL